MRQEMKRRIDEGFFIISSENLHECKSSFYGYAFSDDKLVIGKRSANNDLSCDNMDGCFICVTNRGTEINITQDKLGILKIYYYSFKGLWVISNSFWKIIEYVSSINAPLSMDDIFAKLFIEDWDIPRTYDRTLAREIKVVSPFTDIRIDIETRKIYFKTIYPLANNVELDSIEGMNIIDQWIAKWSGYIRGFYNGGWLMRINLTGGFDSRITYALSLAAGINLSSSKVKLYTLKGRTEGERKYFKDDISIATELAQMGGGIIVSEEDCPEGMEHLSADEEYEIWKQTFSNSSRIYWKLYRNSFFPIPIMDIGGSYGECIRGDFYDYETSLLSIHCNKGEANSEKIMSQLKEERKETWRKIAQLTNANDFHDYENALMFKYIGMQRTHFGVPIYQNLLRNCLSLAPMADVNLFNLRVKPKENQELIFAVILNRIEPKLLDIGFDRGRGFKSGIIERAKEICEEYESHIQIDLSKNYEYKTHKIQLKDGKEDANMFDLLYKDFCDKESQDLFLSKFPEFGKGTLKIIEKNFFNQSISDREQDMVAVVSTMRMLSAENKGGSTEK